MGDATDSHLDNHRDNRRDNHTGFVSIVGAGPWDPGLLTLAGARRLQRAEVVIADYLANPNLLLHAPPDAEIIQRTAGPHGMTLRQAALNELLVERALAGRYVVRLKGGDPCMFGRGAEEAQLLRDAGIPYEFIPGVSSPIAAPEVAGIPVTHRDHTPAVTFVSGYEAYNKAGLQVAWEHLAQSAGTLVLMMSVKNARTNAAKLVEAGRPPTTPAALVRWGTRGISTVLEGTLGDIADKMDAARWRAPSVLVVGEVVRLRAQLSWVAQRPLFGKRVLCTRPRQSIAPLLERLSEDGADAVALPCLTVLPPQDPQAFERQVASATTLDGVILSSRFGVDAFFDSLARQELDTRALAGVRVLAIGRATAAACRARGIIPDLVPDSSNSEGVVDLLRSRALLDKRWLHPRARDGRATLGEAIAQAGGVYELGIAYRTERPRISAAVAASLRPVAEGGEGLDAVCLHSGRSAEHLVRNLEEALGAETTQRLLSGAQLISAGPVTTRAISKLGFRAAVTASDPSDDGVFRALQSALDLAPTS